MINRHTKETEKSDTPYLEQPPYFTNPSHFMGKFWPPPLLFRKISKTQPPPPFLL